MPKQYDAEAGAKAVRLVQDHREDYASEYEAIRTVAGRLGMNPETLRTWVRRTDKLGYNTGAIPDMALIVSEYLRREDVEGVTIVAHSKGGLIAKHALSDPGTLARVRHVIAGNTPFSGSRYASLVPPAGGRAHVRAERFADPNPQSRAGHQPTNQFAVQGFDSQRAGTSFLEGAENIVLPTIGHFRPLGAPGTLQLISTTLRRSPTDTGPRPGMTRNPDG
jgi:hypothetical protein